MIWSVNGQGIIIYGIFNVLEFMGQMFVKTRRTTTKHVKKKKSVSYVIRAHTFIQNVDSRGYYNI